MTFGATLIGRDIRTTLAALPIGLACALGAACPSSAEVFEIGSTGAVTVYRAPAIYTSEGVHSLAPVTLASPAVFATSTIGELLKSAAERQALSPDLLEAVAWRESRLRHTALSPKGAAGVMQIMPATALQLGVDRFDLRQNIEGGATYLRQMLNRYSGSVPLALAAYNAGPGAVDRYRGIPPYRETQAYVTAIVNRVASRSAASSVALRLLIEP